MTIDEVIESNFNILIKDIKQRHEQAGQRVTGNTINSLEYKKQSVNNRVLLGNDYIGVLERGRKGGKVPSNFIEILRTWANKKGITFKDEKEANRWLQYQKWRIQKFGTRMYQNRETKDIFTTAIEDFKTRLFAELESTIVIEIENNIFKNGNT